MKKHDIKYIIKKVIIGVLIVLIVGNLNKCNVKADTSTDIYINGNPGYPSQIITTEDVCSSAPGFCIYNFNSMIGSVPYNFHLYQTASLNPQPTQNPDGYHFVLTSIDNSFKYYFVVFAHEAYGKTLNINAVDFVYDDNGNLDIKLYDENSEEINWVSNYVFFYSFILTNKDVEYGIAPEFLEQYSLLNYSDITENDYQFRLSYNQLSPLKFLPTKDFFNIMLKEESTIPFILIDNATIETINIQNGLIEGLDQGNNSSIVNSLVSSFPDSSRVNSWLGFLELPFDFLRSFTSSTCSSISIPFPFTNESITLPCVRSLLNEKVPTISTIILIVINGLLVYRITMKNIDVITDILKADDDKLEVVDL